MAIRSLAPILTTNDMERSARFYVDVLGFTCGMQTADYSNLYRDGVRIMLAAPRSANWEGASFTGQLYLHSDSADEVDALWSKLRGHADVVDEIDDRRGFARVRRSQYSRRKFREGLKMRAFADEEPSVWEVCEVSAARRPR